MVTSKRTAEAPDTRMTADQRSRLQRLSREAGFQFAENLTEREATARIQELEAQVGRNPRSRQVESVPKGMLEEPVDINTADREELRLVEGIGDGRADEIVAWRAANGFFESVDDLQHLPDFDGEVLQQVRDKLRV